MKRLLAVALLSIFMIGLSGCGQGDTPSQNAEVTIVFKDYGTITLELYYDVAPNTVKSFVKNIEDGVYTNNEIHRIIENFVIQGGRSTVSCKIEAEVTNNPSWEGENNLSHVRGLISMARTSDYNSATTQFFIVHEASTFLDEEYAGFGMVIEGFDVLDAIAAAQTGAGDVPTSSVVIESITVDTFGYNYEDPDCQ